MSWKTYKHAGALTNVQQFIEGIREPDARVETAEDAWTFGQQGEAPQWSEPGEPEGGDTFVRTDAAQAIPGKKHASAPGFGPSARRALDVASAAKAKDVYKAAGLGMEMGMDLVDAAIGHMPARVGEATMGGILGGAAGMAGGAQVGKYTDLDTPNSIAAGTLGGGLLGAVAGPAAMNAMAKKFAAEKDAALAGAVARGALTAGKALVKGSIGAAKAGVKARKGFIAGHGVRGAMGRAAGKAHAVGAKTTGMRGAFNKGVGKLGIGKDGGRMAGWAKGDHVAGAKSSLFDAATNTATVGYDWNKLKG